MPEFDFRPESGQPRCQHSDEDVRPEFFGRSAAVVIAHRNRSGDSVQEPENLALKRSQVVLIGHADNRQHRRQNAVALAKRLAGDRRCHEGRAVVDDQIERDRRPVRELSPRVRRTGQVEPPPSDELLSERLRVRLKNGELLRDRVVRHPPDHVSRTADYHRGMVRARRGHRCCQPNSHSRAQTTGQPRRELTQPRHPLAEPRFRHRQGYGTVLDLDLDVQPLRLESRRPLRQRGQKGEDVSLRIIRHDQSHLDLRTFAVLGRGDNAAGQLAV
ncbi:hypothetical protein GCM10009565_51940 [Amycolatopsis albidoflavus]